MAAEILTPIFWKILILIIIANSVPPAAKSLFGKRYSLPINEKLLGGHKTWRGVILSIFYTSFAAFILGFSVIAGILIAAGAMLGDIFSSYTKRRLGYKPGADVPGLDQVPESAIALLLLNFILPIQLAAAVLIIIFFIPAEILGTKFYAWAVAQLKKIKILNKILRALDSAGVEPNQLTLLSGFFAVLMIVALLKTFLFSAIIFLGLTLIFDGLDGSLARYAKKVTKFGGMADSIKDWIVWNLFFISANIGGFISINTSIILICLWNFSFISLQIINRKKK